VNAETAESFQGVLEVQYHMWVPAWAYPVLLTLYLPVMIMGGVFNALVAYIVFTNAKLRADPRNCFIVALAFSDMALCTFTSPLTLWYTLAGHWPLGETFYSVARHSSRH